MPEKSFSPSTTRAKAPFDLIHSDLKEFPVLSYGKYKYVMTLLDDHTSYGWTYKLKNKSDAIHALCNWLAYVDTHFGKKPKAFMSDFGGEFTSKEFVDELNKRGIEIRRSAPNPPQ